MLNNVFGIIFVVKYDTKYVELPPYMLNMPIFPHHPLYLWRFSYAQLFIKLVESPGRILFQFDTQEDIETMTLTGLFIFYLPQINKIPAHATAFKRLSHV